MSNQRRCGSGHVYDADIYATCPYCNGQSNSIQFNSVPVAPGMDSGRTMAPGMGGYDAPMMPSMGGGFGNPEEIPVTIAPVDYVNRDNQERKTIGVFGPVTVDPVVGWVVCIEGTDRGKSYNLYAKVNTIGRGQQCDINLKDPKVSREQVKLSYDAKHNNFYLIPGDSSSTSYLNDQPLYVPTLITPYDMVEIGETKLLFIPFCGDKFQWNNNN